MKTMKNYLIILMGVAMAMTMASCYEESDFYILLPDNDKVMVTFKMGGEITSDETALTRAEGSTDDLYGVQIDKDGSHYAYGLFDDVSKIQLAMPKNSKYNIIITLVKNGKITISNYQSSGYYRYYYPFRDGNSATPLTNYFLFTSEYRGRYFTDGIQSGYSYMGEVYRYYPLLDRFYGELNDFTPTEDCIVTIPMKRTAFGLKYKVSGITDGSVSVKINKSFTVDSSNKNEVFFEKNDITDTYSSEEKIITFKDVYDAWQYADNYTDEVTVSIVWTRGVGIVEDLGTKTVRVKRNRMNVININLSANDGNAGLGIVLDDIDYLLETASIHVE